MYNLIEYSDDYSKASGRLWQYYRDEPDLTDAGTIAGYLLLITVFHLNLNKKQQVKQLLMVEKILK